MWSIFGNFFCRRGKKDSLQNTYILKLDKYDDLNCGEDFLHELKQIFNEPDNPYLYRDSLIFVTYKDYIFNQLKKVLHDMKIVYEVIFPGKIRLDKIAFYDFKSKIIWDKQSLWKLNNSLNTDWSTPIVFLQIPSRRCFS